MFDWDEEENQPEDEFDAVTRFGEPDEAESIGPDIPRAPDPAAADVDSDLLVSFWRLVVIFNVALLATSVGLMFVVFEADLTLGGQLTLAGLAAFAFGFYRYRRAKATVVAEAKSAQSGEATTPSEADESPSGDDSAEAAGDDQNG